MAMTLEEAREELAKLEQVEDPASKRLAEARKEFAAAQPNSPERLGQTVLSYGRRGIENLVGFPADASVYAGEALKGGGNLLARALRAAGIDAPGIQPGSPEEAAWKRGLGGSHEAIANQIAQSGSEGIRRNVTDPYLGKDKFQAESVPEKYLGSVAEALPNALGGKGLLSKVLQVVGGGVGAQAGEDVTKNTRFDKFGRLIGGLAGAGPGILMSKPGGVTSGSAAYDDAVKTLEDRGSVLTAGQKLDSMPLRQTEAALGGGTFNKMLRGQQDIFNTNRMADIGFPGRLPTAENLSKARMEIGGKLDNLAASTRVPLGPGLMDDLKRVSELHRDTNGLVSPGVEKMRQRIIQIAGENGGYIDGAAYQGLTTQLREMAAATGRTGNAEAFDNIRNALDDAVGRTMAPDVLKQWNATRTQYRGLMDVERSIALPGGERGDILPANLRAGIASQEGPAAAAEVRNPMMKDANAGATVMTDAPSGALSSAAAHLGPAAATAAMGMGAGPSMTALVAPFVAGKMLMSKPVQAMMAPSDNLRKILAGVLAGSSASGRMNRGAP